MYSQQRGGTVSRGWEGGLSMEISQKASVTQKRIVNRNKDSQRKMCVQEGRSRSGYDKTKKKK